MIGQATVVDWRTIENDCEKPFIASGLQVYPLPVTLYETTFRQFVSKLLVLYPFSLNLTPSALFLSLSFAFHLALMITN